MNSAELPHSLVEIWERILAFIPNLIAALLILGVGFFIAKVAEKAVVVLLRKLRLDQISHQVGLEATLKKLGFEHSSAGILGKVIFWIFMLVAVITASDALGMTSVSRSIDVLVAYLPNVIAATLILVGGLLLAHFAAGLVKAGSQSLGVEYGPPLAKLAHGLILVVILILAVDQLGIETSLISQVVQIFLMAAGGAIAIALGFGSQGIAKNIVAGLYARDIFPLDSKISFGNNEGFLKEIGMVSTTIVLTESTDLERETQMNIPNTKLVDEVVIWKPN